MLQKPQIDADVQDSLAYGIGRLFCAPLLDHTCWTCLNPRLAMNFKRFTEP